MVVVERKPVKEDSVEEEAAAVAELIPQILLS